MKKKQLIGFDIVEDGAFDDGMLNGAITIQDFIYEVEKETRSINFEDMLDSAGTRIFASLSENGKGGDVLDIGGRIYALFINEAVIQTYMFKWDDLKSFNRKVIGIQE